MDAFALNAGSPGTGPDEPGPASYTVKYPGDRIGGGRMSTANPLSDIDWTIIRSKSIPGPGQYPQTPLQLAGGGRFSTANPKGELDWIQYRSKHIPGPSHYGTPQLVKMEGGVLFGPEDGPEYFSRPRPLTAPQKLKLEATATAPGPGSYKLTDSVGRQVESAKKSPARVSFGSGTRSQRRKVYMGHGVTTTEANLGEGPGYSYCHLYLPEALRPYSPACFIGSDKKGNSESSIDSRIEEVQRRRAKIDDKRKSEREKAAMELERQNKVKQQKPNAFDYNWLRGPGTGRPRTVDPRHKVRSRDGVNLPRSREYRRPPSVPMATALRFNNAGMDTSVVPGPKYNVSGVKQRPSPSFSFTQYAKRTVELVIENTIRENIPGPGSYPCDMASRMDSLTRIRDLKEEEESIVSEEVALLQEKFDKVKAKEKETIKAYNETMQKDAAAEKKGLTKPEDGRLSDRARELAERAVARTRKNSRKAERELVLARRELGKIRQSIQRCKTPSTRFGSDPGRRTPGSVPMATGTRDAADKMHFPGKKLNPATAFSPGPAAYNVAGNSSKATGGGRFSTSFVKDETEWIMYRSRQIPGPSKYLPPKMWGKLSDSRFRSAPNLCFATAGRDARAKQYMPGPLNGVLGGDAPGPQLPARPTIGPQVLSTYRNGTVPIFSSATKKKPPPDTFPGPGSYKPPHNVYSKRIRDNRQAVIEAKLANITKSAAMAVQRRQPVKKGKHYGKATR